MKLNTIIENRKKLLNILPEPKPEPIIMKHPLLWEPKVGDTMFVTDVTGQVYHVTYGANYDELCFIYGNCWRTCELAEKYGILGVVTPYLREIARYNSNPDGSYWWPDWTNLMQGKYKHYFEGQVFISSNNSSRVVPDLFYFKDTRFIPSPTAIEAFKKYLGVL
jgi:hypothetical protein